MTKIKVRRNSTKSMGKMSQSELRKRINAGTKTQMNLEIKQWNPKLSKSKDKELEGIHKKNHREIESLRKAYKKKSGKDYSGFGR